MTELLREGMAQAERGELIEEEEMDVLIERIA
jgi:predicted transcriptional regulator